VVNSECKMSVNSRVGDIVLVVMVKVRIKNNVMPNLNNFKPTSEFEKLILPALTLIGAGITSIH